MESTTHTALPNAELVLRYTRNSDHAAFAELVERFGPMVLGVSRRLLSFHEDADDATQIVFAELARRAGTIEDPEAVAGWLHTITVRVAHRLRERRPNTKPLVADPIDPRLSIDELCRRGDLEILSEELDNLPDSWREPLLLRYFAGLSNEETAAQLGTTINALEGRLKRGKNSLRVRLLRRGVSVASVLAMVAPVSADAGHWAAVHDAAGQLASDPTSLTFLPAASSTASVTPLLTTKSVIASGTAAVVLLMLGGMGNGSETTSRSVLSTATLSTVVQADEPQDQPSATLTTDQQSEIPTGNVSPPEVVAEELEEADDFAEHLHARGFGFDHDTSLSLNYLVNSIRQLCDFPVYVESKKLAAAGISADTDFGRVTIVDSSIAGVLRFVLEDVIGDLAYVIVDDEFEKRVVVTTQADAMRLRRAGLTTPEGAEGADELRKGSPAFYWRLEGDTPIPWSGNEPVEVVYQRAVRELNRHLKDVEYAKFSFYKKEGDSEVAIGIPQPALSDTLLTQHLAKQRILATRYPDARQSELTALTNKLLEALENGEAEGREVAPWIRKTLAANAVYTSDELALQNHSENENVGKPDPSDDILLPMLSNGAVLVDIGGRTKTTPSEKLWEDLETSINRRLGPEVRVTIDFAEATDTRVAARLFIDGSIDWTDQGRRDKHAEVSRVIDEVLDAKFGEQPESHRRQKKRTLEEILQSDASVEFIGQPLDTVLRFFSETYNVPFDLDEKSLSLHSIEPSVPIKELVVSDVKLSDALTMVLAEEIGGLDYTIRGDRIVVTTQDEAAKTVTTRAYDIEQIDADPDSVLESIIKHPLSSRRGPIGWIPGTDPDNFSIPPEPYETGAVTLVNFRNQSSLVTKLLVTQSHRGHEAVEEFLAVFDAAKLDKPETNASSTSQAPRELSHSRIPVPVDNYLFWFTDGSDECNAMQAEVEAAAAMVDENHIRIYDVRTPTGKTMAELQGTSGPYPVSSFTNGRLMFAPLHGNASTLELIHLVTHAKYPSRDDGDQPNGGFLSPESTKPKPK